MRRFRDRTEAGRQLGTVLRRYEAEQPIVLGLPRGGVPVAYEVARALHAPLDVWIVRKIGVPWHPELGVGAVAEGDYVHVSRDVLEGVGMTHEELAVVTEAKRREVEQRVRKLRGDRPRPDLRDRTVILVDDGIATGGTVRAAIRAIRSCYPKKIVLAVPVAAPDTIRALGREVDELVCLMSPAMLYGVGVWYEDFTQVEDDEVLRLLEEARNEHAPDPRGVVIQVGDASLAGDLTIPSHATGLVLFAHGSGSSRRSPRNRLVAQALHDRGLATLLFDLLTVEEERADAIDGHLRFDIPLLARRLIEATDWVRSQAPARGLSIGYFGASTGAAAALIAAARRPDVVRTVVSRGGRPDLADAALPSVRAATLLVVGGADTTVLALNRSAFARITAPKRLAIVPGATHLFEEPGALDEVARLAGDWLVTHLSAQQPSPAARA